VNDHIGRRHDDTADPETVLRRAIKRLRDAAERSRARRALDKMVGWLDHTAGLIDWGNRRTSELRDQLDAAKRGDVTTEMCEEIDAAQVRSYLEGADEWQWEPYDHESTSFDGNFLHDSGVGTFYEKSASPDNLMRIAAAEGRGEIDVWLDVRAQEVGE